MENQNKRVGNRHHFLFIIALLLAFSTANSQSFVGVNYGEVADNLPPPTSTASLLQSTTISKLRLYGSDPSIINALAGSPISLVLGVPNSDVPSLASSPSSASQWLASNLLPFLPSSQISLLSVGNELLSSGDPSLPPALLPAMQNLRSALASYPSVKISTVHSMAVLSQSDPPSAGAFHSDLAGTLTDVLGFLKDDGAPFMINPYPYFAYRDDPRPETLAFCLFEPNPGRLDSGSGLVYSNMFDAQVDAVRSALNGLGFGDVEIVIAETGWPYNGDADEVGATVDNARAYNGGLVSHLRSLVGTPLMPGKSVDTFIFALYNEDLKPGPTSERSFGLFQVDGTENYDAGLSKASFNSGSAPSQPSTSSPQTVAGPPPPLLQSTASGGYCAPTTTQTTAASETGVSGNTTQQGSSCYIPSSVQSFTPNYINKPLLLCMSFIFLLLR